MGIIWRLLWLYVGDLFVRSSHVSGYDLLGLQILLGLDTKATCIHTLDKKAP